MKFDLKEVIIIAEYVRVASKSAPKVKSIEFINEYFEVKKSEQKTEALDWWLSLSEKKKWNLTINHLKHWENFNEDEILKLWFECGYGA